MARPKVTQILIDCVDRHRHLVSAYVVTTGDVTHRIGFLASEGWFCATCTTKPRRCPQIKIIRDITPPMENPHANSGSTASRRATPAGPAEGGTTPGTAPT